MTMENFDIANAEEVDRMINLYDEEAIIYETNRGDVVVVFEDQTIRVFKDIEHAVRKLYKFGYIF